MASLLLQRLLVGRVPHRYTRIGRQERKKTLSTPTWVLQEGKKPLFFPPQIHTDVNSSIAGIGRDPLLSRLLRTQAGTKPPHAEVLKPKLGSEYVTYVMSTTCEAEWKPTLSVSGPALQASVGHEEGHVAPFKFSKF